MPKKKKRVTIPQLEVDLIPVLSCMFLLIPALLLAMEAANWSSIPVSPPRHVATGDPGRPTDPLLHLAVQVREDGFAVSLDRCAGCGDAPQVVGLEGDDGLDGLREAAEGIKASYPSLEDVHLSAEGTIPLQTLVETMDVLRGSQCSLLPGEEGTNCLFPGVVIDA
ncbi:MAG: ExbD/TolR family protein [Nannocystales bacterium]